MKEDGRRNEASDVLYNENTWNHEMMKECGRRNQASN
jgi:hypothetical protein